MSPAFAARFAADWQRVWGDDRPVGLAVSGGSDSLALLLLACAALPGRFAVATVDHGLRPEAAGEAAAVARLCVAWNVPHTTLCLTLAAGSAIQERARDARYAALAGWLQGAGLAALVTAHHADDQAETLLMRFNRGAGLRGLAGMRPMARVPGHDAPLLRPLLGWRRAELSEIVALAGVVAADDPSNHDVRYERVRVRQALAQADWLDPAAIAASAAHLAEADAALDWAVARDLHTIAAMPDGLAFDPADVPRVLTLRMLERIVMQLAQGTPRGRDLARWHDLLAGGAVATLAGVRGDGRARPWRFTRAPAHRRLRKSEGGA
ncbi:tRNA lysidine(34) synthetase TilS [Novosphingobium sp.]|uniref:tRNA lysidine(34) synthetase TilS n=1 Tax=Novosphingobium sp. TaxID=1874826 RepID=UPI0038B757F9